MPIRFHCKRCHQLLGIATRKAGTNVECPKCGFAQTVPSEEAAAAAMTMLQGAKAREAEEAASDLTVYDDIPAAIEAAPVQSLPDEAESTEAPAPPPPPDQLQPVPEGMILYSRRTLYIHAILFVAVGIIGFGVGYLIGRGDASLELLAAREEASKLRILVEGRLVYDPGSGELAGDEQSVVIVLPAEKSPEKKLSFRGLSPKNTPPRETSENVRSIHELGGAYVRTDATGAFSLVLPEQGRYYLLLISRQTARPENSEMEEVDLDELSRYFEQAHRLVGQAKYRWTFEEFRVPTEVEYSFGVSGK